MNTRNLAFSTVARQMGVELEPEPEGGEELTPLSTMEGSRVKNMGECAEGSKGEDGETVFDFWLTAIADGGLVKKLRAQVSKDAAKNANFPGFRKVCPMSYNKRNILCTY